MLVCTSFKINRFDTIWTNTNHGVIKYELVTVVPYLWFCTNFSNQPHILMAFLTLLSSVGWKLGKTPMWTISVTNFEWSFQRKIETVICIPKPRKPPQLPFSYQLISLLPSLFRVTEQIIVKKLNEFTESNNFLPVFQNGFYRRHGCDHQFLCVVESFSDNPAAVFLGIWEAFDRIWHDESST